MLIAFTSCKKQDLKKPVDVDFVYRIVNHGEANPKLHFQTGEISLADFSIKGDRIEGEDINFSRNYAPLVTSDLDNNIGIEDLAFDLPQGDYQSIDIRFSCQSQQEPSLWLSGFYKPQGGPPIDLLLEINESKVFEIQAVHSNGSAQMKLDADLPVKGSIEMDPYDWFENVSEEMMENAEITELEDNETILINSQNNTSIYNIIVANLTTGNEIILREE